MPLTEKERGEKVRYPYPVKEVEVQDSIRIAYIDEGNPQGEVILFVHGMGSGVPVWEKNLKELKKEYRCIALDLPGHGLSSRGDYPYSIRFYSGVVQAFLEKLQLRGVTVVGHSLGGHIAIMTALLREDLVERLVLVSPAGIEPYTAMEKGMLINMTAGVVASGNAFTKNRLNYLVGFCENADEAGELASRMAFYKEDAAAFGKMMLGSVEGMLLEGVNHTLDKIRQPCLILVGKEDKVSPFQFLRGDRYADILSVEAAKIPHCKLVIYSPCGHFVQWQKPEAFNNELRSFLKSKQTV